MGRLVRLVVRRSGLPAKIAKIRLQRILVVVKFRAVVWFRRVLGRVSQRFDQAGGAQVGKSRQIADRFQPEMFEEFRRGAEGDRSPGGAPAAAEPHPTRLE